jgi:hypothetical protein
MSKSRRKISTSVAVYALLLIVFGILFLIGGAGTATHLMEIFVTVMGVALIVWGVLSIAHKDVTAGIIQILVGVLLIVFSWTVIWIAYIALGIGLAIIGVSGIVQKQGRLVTNIVDLIIGIVLILLAFGVQGAWSAANVFFYIVGALMIVDGIMVLFHL